MNKSTKIIITCLSVATIFVIIFEVIPWVVNIFTPLDKEKSEEIFHRDNEDILIITEYYINSGYTNVCIGEIIKDGYMLVETNKVKIPDKAVKKAANRLMKRGYILISRDDNTIDFVMWRGTQDVVTGIAYSIDGINKPEIPYLTQLEPLDEDRWFYYVADYNEWRREKTKTIKQGDDLR